MSKKRVQKHRKISRLISEHVLQTLSGSPNPHVALAGGMMDKPRDGFWITIKLTKELIDKYHLRRLEGDIVKVTLAPTIIDVIADNTEQQG